VRALTAALSLVLSGCTLGYDAHTHANGVAPEELACAQRLFIGEKPHIGMPHVTADADDVVAAKKALRRVAPAIDFVDDPSSADFVVSVLMVPEHVCTHCDNGPDTSWQAIVERGGSSHQREYSSAGPFLVLSGRVNEGSHASQGFARQLAALLACKRDGA
jgi:hypothetical protein